MIAAGVGLVIVAFGVCVASLLISRYQRGPLPDWVPVVFLLVIPFLLGAGVATIVCSCFL